MIIIDASLCDGCGDCVAACPNDCLKWGDEDNYESDILYVIEGDCTQCNVCVSVCPNGAIRLGEVTYDHD